MPFMDYRPYGAAKELFTCKLPEVILSGPAGTGKSRGLLEKLHVCCEKYPGCRILIVRKTRTSLTNTTLVTYEQIVLPHGAAALNYQGAKYPNGSIISFGGMDKATKIMSSEYDIAAVFEATELTEDDWEMLTTRLRWGKIPYQQIIGDCNPSFPKHWLKQRANRAKTAMLESRHEDNPALWDGSGWTPKGQAYIEKLDALSGARYLRLRKGIWAAAEGMVYTDYDASIHLIDRFEIPKDWKRIWSVDFGFTNPFVWQAWARDPDGRLFRYREIYKTQRLVEDHCKSIRDAAVGEPYPIAIICDHDAEDRATLERHLGMMTGGAYKAITPGIQAVQARLKKAKDGRPRMYLMRDSLYEPDQLLADAHLPTCSEEEIDSYSWPTNPNARHGENPIDKDNHGMDALRYCVAFADSLAIDDYRIPGFQGVTDRVQISRY